MTSPTRQGDAQLARQEDPRLNFTGPLQREPAVNLRSKLAFALAQTLGVHHRLIIGKVKDCVDPGANIDDIVNITTIEIGNMTEIADGLVQGLGNSCLIKTATTGEPIFVLRAQDGFAADLVDRWAHLLETSPTNPTSAQIAKAADARKIAREMRNWGFLKLPD